MHEDVVSEPEGDTQGEEVGEGDDEEELGGEGEVEEGVGGTLTYDWLFAGFADEAVDDLTYNYTDEIGSLGVFSGFGSVADGFVSVRWDLFDFALAVGVDVLGELGCGTVHSALDHGHTQVIFRWA